MKKRYLFIIFAFLTCFKNDVIAECDYEYQAKINNLAGLVTSEYQIYEKIDEYYDEGFGENVKISSWYSRIYVYNVTDELYIEVKDLGKFYSTDDDTIIIDTGITDDIKEYQINIMAVDSSCDKNPIRTIYESIPRFNAYSTYPQCLEHPDYYYCNKFVFLDKITQSEFLTGINNYVNRQDDTINEDSNWFNNILNFFKNYYPSIIILIILILGLSVFLWKKKVKEKKYDLDDDWSRK